mmetsp:Transcript_24224/g.36789  ORF Transcript_24224/g.36789 Transcript_24224/m.36789 type:complete len:345 (-) Transcript_24224:1284-2318(-)
MSPTKVGFITKSLPSSSSCFLSLSSCAPTRTEGAEHVPLLLAHARSLLVTLGVSRPLRLDRVAVGVLVGVEEEELLVGGEGPDVRRALSLSSVDRDARLDHRLQTQLACDLRLLVVVALVMELVKLGLHGSEGLLDRGRVHTRLCERREDLLLDHVDEAQGLHLNEARVVLELHVLAREELLLAHHVHLGEELDVLGRAHHLRGLHARVDAPHAVLDRRLRPCRVIAVAVVDHLPVLVEGLLARLLGLHARLELGSHVVESLSSDGAEHGVDHRHVLSRADGTELEAVASIGEGGGAIAVLRRDLEGGDRLDAGLEHLLGRLVLVGLSVTVVVQELGEGVAEVG